MGRVLCPLLILPSSVLAQALLPLWPSGVLQRVQSLFLCLRPRMSVENGCPTGVPVARISGMGRVRGGVLPLHAGWLVDTRAGVPLSSGVVSMGASALGCMMVVSNSLTTCVGPALDLAEAESNQGRSLTESAWLSWERTSLKVVSTCSAILAHLSSCHWTTLNCWSSKSLVSPVSSRASSHSILSLAWVASCDLAQGKAETEHFFSLLAHISLGMGGDNGDWQWQMIKQTMFFSWAFPQCLSKERVKF